MCKNNTCPSLGAPAAQSFILLLALNANTCVASVEHHNIKVRLTTPRYTKDPNLYPVSSLNSVGS